MSGKSSNFFTNKNKSVNIINRSMDSWKIFPVHNHGYLYMASCHKQENSDEIDYIVTCWNMARKTLCFKSKIEDVISRFAVKTLFTKDWNTSYKILQANKLDRRVVLGGGVNRGCPLIIDPKKRFHQLYNRSQNISGAYINKKQLKTPSKKYLNSQSIERIDLTPEDTEEVYFYRSDMFMQINGATVLIESIDFDDNSQVKILHVKVEIGDNGYELKIVDVVSKETLFSIGC